MVLGMLLTLTTCITGPPRAPPPDSAHSVSWGYEGDIGPAHWYALDPAYAIARDGKAQSPIDIDTKDAITDSALEELLIAYHKTLFEIENNGHTIELLPTATGNGITLDGEFYALRQFHFHAPSEHRIDGNAFDMELHFVHQDRRGNPAVLGLMIAEGACNKTLGKIFENAPREISVEGTSLPEIEIDLAELFSPGGIYRYEGSLTTPPCTEGVKWNLVMEPIEMSRPQIDAFRALYQGNNRPVQNRYGRHIYAVKGRKQAPRHTS
jgi:carbonic anhydrase